MLRHRNNLLAGSLLLLLLLAGCAESYAPYHSVRQSSHSVALNWRTTSPAEPSLRVSSSVTETQRFNWNHVFDSAGQDLGDLPGIVVDETMKIGSDWDLLFPLLAAGGGSIALHNSGADARMERDIRQNRFLGKTMDDVTYIAGGPPLHFAAAGLWYALAAGNEDPLGQEQAWTMLKALSVNGTLTLGLKLARDNETPNGKSLAWPSGHTSSSFTVAAVLDELYGPEVGIPAYLGAGFVGYRMMESGDHWPSDVLFGAVLGYIVGHHVAGNGTPLEIGGFEVVPWSHTCDGRTVTGIGLSKSF